MNRISAHMLGIDRGSVTLFSDFEDNGPMWAGHGPREAHRSVTFATPFLAPPHVLLGVSLWDADCTTNLRADLQAVDVTAEGFTIRFRTWGDTRLARLRADWTAMGEAPDPERWNV